MMEAAPVLVRVIVREASTVLLEAALVPDSATLAVAVQKVELTLTAVGCVLGSTGTVLHGQQASSTRGRMMLMVAMVS